MKNPRIAILTTIMTIACVGQIILAILLCDKDGNGAVINLGWFILWISAIFGWLPIFTFRKWGGVPKGRSYIQTTVLVDRGVYAIVRHPQYLAGMLIGVALPLISQHWAVALLGVVVVITFYISAYDEESSAIDKFGEAYKAYMQRVPRFNFLLGLLRWIKARGTRLNNGGGLKMNTAYSPHGWEIQVMRWAARIISLLAAAAWLLVMLDILLCELVFGCISLTWETGLLVLLALVSMVSVICAWRWEGPGGVVMVLWGLIFTIIAYATSHPYEVFSILVTGVPFLIAGSLFLASWWRSRKGVLPMLTNHHAV